MVFCLGSKVADLAVFSLLLTFLCCMVLRPVRHWPGHAMGEGLFHLSTGLNFTFRTLQIWQFLSTRHTY